MSIRNKTFYILIVTYLVIITGGSLTPVALNVEISNWDKVIHVLLYIPLGFLLSLPKVFSCVFLNFFILFVLGALYGGVLEVLQQFVPGRTPSWYDEIANVVGVGIGFSLGFLVAWIKKMRRRPFPEKT